MVVRHTCDVEAGRCEEIGSSGICFERIGVCGGMRPMCEGGLDIDSSQIRRTHYASNVREESLWVCRDNGSNASAKHDVAGEQQSSCHFGFVHSIQRSSCAGGDQQRRA
jgi:hypothetical protein